jgi:hypothetical protein
MAEGSFGIVFALVYLSREIKSDQGVHTYVNSFFKGKKSENIGIFFNEWSG